ncbi:MAG: hypothetical protein KGJ64_01655 [Betaproteobacteria bacterium]|nr:hypothetical protein [Betaproteobacteria bacterium]
MKYLQSMFRTGLLPVIAALSLAGCGGGGGATDSAGSLLASKNTTPPGLSKGPSGTANGNGGSTSSGSTTSSSTTSSSTTSSSTGSCVPPTYGTTSGPLAVVAQSCPAGTQGQPYAGCTVVAQGGVPPYTFSVVKSSSYPTLPEGMSMASCNGQITASVIGGQGYYQPMVQVTDAAGTVATAQLSFEIAGNDAFLQSIFPSTSIFHHRVDALPVDTSPAAPIPSVYASAHIRVFFGNTTNAPFPNGIPAISVPAAQSDVPVSTTLYQSYFTSGPIPDYAPIETTANATGADQHVIVYRQGSSSQPPALYEMWQGAFSGSSATGWTDSSNALWSDTTSNTLPPQDTGTADAAGLPVGPLLVTADEVIGTGTPSAPNGVIQHPIRFTLNHMLNYWVWPATATSGVGYCTNSSGQSISVRQELSQSTPPASCNNSAPAGEIYRLKSGVGNPSCAATSPQAAVILTAMRQYGIILADNGTTGGLIGTPDSRWNDADLACLSQLVLSDFEPVNVSSLMVSTNSGLTQ